MIQNFTVNMTTGKLTINGLLSRLNIIPLPVQNDLELSQWDLKRTLPLWSDACLDGSLGLMDATENAKRKLYRKNRNGGNYERRTEKGI